MYSDLGRWRPAEAEHKGHFARERGTPSVHIYYTAEMKMDIRMFEKIREHLLVNGKREVVGLLRR